MVWNGLLAPSVVVVKDPVRNGIFSPATTMASSLSSVSTLGLESRLARVSESSALSTAANETPSGVELGHRERGRCRRRNCRGRIKRVVAFDPAQHRADDAVQSRGHEWHRTVAAVSRRQFNAQGVDLVHGHLDDRRLDQDLQTAHIELTDGGQQFVGGARIRPDDERR